MPEKDGSPREEYWRDKIAKQLESGLSQVKFCEKEGLGANSFSSWKSRIKQLDEDNEQAIKRALKQAIVKRAARIKGEATFVPLVSPEEAPKPLPKHSGENCIAEIVFAGGSIRVISGADTRTLGALLKALKEVVLC